jgi:hypothetical protein
MMEVLKRRGKFGHMDMDTHKNMASSWEQIGVTHTQTKEHQWLPMARKEIGNRLSLNF